MQSMQPLIKSWRSFVLLLKIAFFVMLFVFSICIGVSFYAAFDFLRKI